MAIEKEDLMLVYQPSSNTIRLLRTAGDAGREFIEITSVKQITLLKIANPEIKEHDFVSKRLEAIFDEFIDELPPH